MYRLAQLWQLNADDGTQCKKIASAAAQYRIEVGQRSVAQHGR